MTRKERIECAIERGYTYNPHTGKVYSRFGREIKGKTSDGYILFSFKIDEKQYSIYGHQFGYYCVYKEIVECIDHINGIKGDNRIDNLRAVTHQENQWNQRKAKGYTWRSDKNKYESYIKVNGVKKYLGLYDKEEDARQAYLEAKEQYHQIG